MAATDNSKRLAALVGGVIAASGAQAVDLPADTAEAMFHTYKGGGVTADGPALLVRKKVMDTVSLTGSYYVDSVSSASIDVVTTASPYKEKRTEFGLAADYAVRDSKITLSGSSSSEPDYTARALGLDVSTESFGGMTTTALGFTYGSDEVSKTGAPEFDDHAKHWRYRLGVTQILAKTWLASANFEIVGDEGFLGSPYRAARVFGAAVPEKLPRTRTSRALQLRSTYDLGGRNVVNAGYRYFWDTWDVTAHTLDAGYSRYFQGDKWLADATLRWTTQDAASFYADNAQQDSTYLTRNRQLSTFTTVGIGGKVLYRWKQEPGKYELKLNAGYEYVRFDFKDFTDIRNGDPYAHGAHVLQLFVSANF